MAAKKQDIFAHPIRKYQTLLTKAKTFFNAEKEKEYQPILIFVFLYVLVGQILEFVAWVPSLGSIGGAEFLSIEGTLLTIVLGILGMFLSPIITIIFTFIIAGITHLAVLYYKKGASYFETWKVIAYAALIPIIYNVFTSLVTTIVEAVNPWPDQSVYSQVPVFGPYYLTALGVLFIIGLFALIHTIYTEIVGIKLYHKLTTKQAAVAVIVPTLVLIFVAIVIGIGIAMFAATVGLVL
ncbi:YIP1 family protein [Candidatus Woesearchaeota archaeon]|nr:YIP1 family protein [Candidatus Woesearchaeota archaeon]